MHLTGPISIAFFVFYMTLFIKSAKADNFDWVILIWTFVIGLPRIIAYFMLFADSLYRRRLYGMVLAGTTACQLLVFTINQFIIFTNSDNYCSRVYAVWHMVTVWGIECGWGITLYEIGQIFALMFYIYATQGAFDHYHMGFKDKHLKAKEKHRMEVTYHAKEGNMKLREEFGNNSVTIDASHNNSAMMMGQQPGMYAQPMMMQQNPESSMMLG
jgi:hypothetical protein